ncbi:MAG: hypothetical protein COC12_01835 [Rhodobacteraceae bacterium]|nr:MAG: hypothetical protein COC12_01835 [Paracoccaceae bacterium]
MPETADHYAETTEETDSQTLAIRQLNDQLRRTFAGGRVVMTSGLLALGDETVYQVLQAVQAFEDFNEGNDPYRTHDFGAVQIDDHNLMWKIDAYDENLEYGSPDPADPSVTTRVLTIFLASEY